MTYTLFYTPEAEAELTNIWIDAVNRDHVTMAISSIEYSLGFTPLKVGIARKSSVNRTLYRAPVGVEYDVIEDDKKVYILGVFYFPYG
jgi:mRNA-degrading endonuclease RelE of RelBE toxin-antitoxin system